MIKKIYRNISWLFIDRVIRIIGEVLIGIWIARYLAPDKFGILNFSLAYCSLFMVFVRLGLDQIVVREIVNNKKKVGYLLGTAFGLKVIGAVIAIILISASCLVFISDNITKITILIISIGFVFKSFDVIDYYYQAQVLSKYVVLARSSAFFLSVLFKIYFIIYEYDVLFFALANTLDLIFFSFFILYSYNKNEDKSITWKFSKKIASRLIKDSWPLAFSLFLITIYMKIDQVMIGSILNNIDVGLYSVSMRLSEIWLFVPAVLVSSLTPYFVELKKKNIDEYKRKLIKVYSLVFWMGIVNGTIMVLFGYEIIVTLLGDIYSKSYQALIINVWSGIFISQAMIRGMWLINENLQIYRLYNNLIGVFLNIIMNMLLIPKLGIAGAAMATLITQGLSTWLFSFIWRPLRESTWGMIKSIHPRYLFN